MLLSILVVVDSSNPYAAENLKQTLTSYMGQQQGWHEQFEIFTISLSEKELEQAGGKVPGLNALMVQEGFVDLCQGEFIWVLPSFVAINQSDVVFSSLLDVLALNVGVVVLRTPSDAGPHKVELLKKAVTLLPPTQNFDDFRYLLRRENLIECYAKDADYQTILTYLSVKEQQRAHCLYAQIPCEFEVVKGVVSHALFELCMSYYSGMRPWQREALNLPRSLFPSLRSNVSKQQAAHVYENDALIHFLFSSCSALEYFSTAMFSERVHGLPKERAFETSRTILMNLTGLSDILLSPLPPHVTRLLSFLSQWQKCAGDSVASETVNIVQPKRGPLNGLWWLDRELKNDLNKLGEKKFMMLIAGLRAAVEGMNAKLAR